MSADLEKWKTRQIAAAVSLGVNPLDAAKSVNEFLALLPDGADPDTYVVPARALEQELASQPILDDVVSSFVGSEHVPSRFKLLLLAGVTDA